jgi:hypothetical protein
MGSRQEVTTRRGAVVEESVGYDADGSMRMSSVLRIEEGEETEEGLSPSLIRKNVSNL